MTNPLSSTYWIAVSYEYTEERYLFVFNRKKYTDQLDYDKWYILCEECGGDVYENGRMSNEVKVLLAPVNGYVMNKISLRWKTYSEEDCPLLDDLRKCTYCGKPIFALEHDIRTFQELGHDKWFAEAEAKRLKAEAEAKRLKEEYARAYRKERIFALESRAREGDLIAYHEWKKLVEDEKV